MKDMLKSKILIGFVFVSLGVLFIDSSMTSSFEKNNLNNEVIVVKAD